MSKMYLVTRGNYSDYMVVAAFDEEHEEAANKLASLIDEGRVEEFDLNQNVEQILQGLTIWQVYIGVSDSAYGCHAWQTYSMHPTRIVSRNNLEVIVMYVFARNREHALKIASEKRAQAIATGEIDNWRQAGK